MTAPQTQDRQPSVDADLFAEMLALLEELIDIEGPCPGTGGWAAKVRATIAKARGAA